MNINILRKLSILIIILLITVNTGLAENIPISDGFDYPVGRPDGKSGENGKGYHVSAGFKDTSYKGIPHLGEDWNSLECAACDLGDPVYAISNGYVRYAHDTKISEWKGIIIIDHHSQPGLKFHNPNGGELIKVSSMYAHLDVDRINEWVSDGDYVSRGQQIGVIGSTPTGSSGIHLHFEIRSDVSINNGPGYSTNTNGWLDPRSFIDSNRPQITPLIGNWINDQKDETGTFDPDTSIFSWINSPMGEPGDIPLVGDWDGDQKATIGIYRPRTAEFHLDNDNNGRIDQKDQKFAYGEIGDFPIVGDWDGNGYDEVGVFREIDRTSQKTTFYLRNSRVPSVFFGMQNDTPVIGDWNKDKKDDIGVFRRYSKDPGHNNNAVFFINYTFRGETKEGNDPFFLYGLNSDIPIAGKWDDDGLTKIGVFRPSTKEFIYNNLPLVVESNSIVSIFDKLKQMGEETINNIKKYFDGTSNAPAQDTIDTPDSNEPSAPIVSIIDQIKSWIEENVPILSTFPATTPAPTNSPTPTPEPKIITIDIETNWGLANENDYNNIILEEINEVWGDNQPPLSPLIVKAMIATESSFKKENRNTNFCGLMQTNCTLDYSTYHNGIWQDPRTSIHAGIQYILNKKKSLNSSVFLSDNMLGETLTVPSSKPEFWKYLIAAYNGGEGTMRNAMAYDKQMGKDYQEWQTIIEPQSTPTQSALYKAVLKNGWGISKYNEIKDYIIGPRGVQQWLGKSGTSIEKLTSNTPTQQAETSKLSGKIIVIDPGHVSTATDRVNSGEYEINHKIGPMLQALLIKDGATVYLTDVMGDTKEPEITERANFAISKDPDLFLSIHTNAAVETARGVEVWLWEGNDKTEFRERELAELIYKNVIEKTQQPSNRGIKEKNNPWDGSPVNNHIGIPILSDYTYPSPAVLVELDFTTYSSPVTFNGIAYDNMRQLMKSSEYQNSAADALRTAIEEYFKVPTSTQTSTSTSTPKTTPKTTSTPPSDPYASIRAVFGQDWQPAPIFISRGLVNQGVYGAVNINGGIDVYTIGPGGMKETPESYYQKFGTYDQNGIVGTVTIDQAHNLGIDVTSISIQTPTSTPTSTPSTTPSPTSTATPTPTPTPDPYASIRAVFGPDWQPAPIFISRGLVNQGVYGAVNINGGIDVYTIGPGGMKETPESYYQKFGTYDQNGIVGSVTIDQARRLGINV